MNNKEFKTSPETFNEIEEFLYDIFRTDNEKEFDCEEEKNNKQHKPL